MMSQSVTGQLRPGQKEVILLATARSSQMGPFVETLRKQSGSEMIIAASAQAALETTRHNRIILAVVDDLIDDNTGLALIRRLIQIDAFMHLSILSDAEEDIFHDLTEGLGLLSMLPLMPGERDARRLWDLLQRVPHA